MLLNRMGQGNKSVKTVYIILLVSFILKQTTTTSSQHVSRTEIIHNLLEYYDYKLPPNFNVDNPLVVSVGMFVNSFDTVSESSMDYSLSVYLRQQWTDPRLQYAHQSNETVLSLDWRMLERLWVPDLFVSNEKEAHFHKVMTPNTYLRIFPLGEIHYSARVSFRVSCPMSLHKFPLDTQVCGMIIETYAYEMSQMRFKWRNESPVELNEDLQLPQFQLIKHDVEERVKYYSTGNFSSLRVKFYLKRDTGYYVIQIYIPSILIVILSWVSFWISYDAVPARISLGVLTVLTMTTQTSGLTSSLPKVSYIKAIDVWLSSCLVFVFAALLEFAFVNVMSRNDRMWTRISRISRRYRNSEQGAFREVNAKRDNEQPSRSQGEKDKQKNWSQLQKQRARVVDNASRVLFPGAFILFIIIYWIVYINTADYET